MCMVNFQSPRADDVSEVIHSVAKEGALVHLERDVSFGETCEDLIDVLNMFFDRFGEDDDIVNVDKT